MKNIYVDFNCDYYNESYSFENEIYNKELRRLAVSKVISIAYENNYLKILYKNKRYVKGINTISIDIKYISKIDIN